MKELQFIQDIDRTLSLIGKAGDWMEKTGKNPSFYWKSENLTKDAMNKFAEDHEFFIGELGGNDVVAAILTESQNAQDWSMIDKGITKKAIYVHWLAVNRDFAGKGFPSELISFAKKLALSK